MYKERKSDKEIYKLNLVQRKTIKKSRAQLQRGEYITNKQLETAENKFLKDK